MKQDNRGVFMKEGTHRGKAQGKKITLRQGRKTGQDR